MGAVVVGDVGRKHGFLRERRTKDDGGMKASGLPLVAFYGHPRTA